MALAGPGTTHQNLTIEEDDFDNVPLLQSRGGAARAKRVLTN
jgi:hypothetical protein